MPKASVQDDAFKTLRLIHTLVLASGNRHKLNEIRTLFKQVSQSLVIRTIKDWQHSFNVDENGESYAANAMLKAQAAMQVCQLPVLADDSGLEVKALKGEPGVQTAYFAGPNATDSDNNRKLLQALKKVKDDKRQARYVCHMVLLMPDGEHFSVEEEVQGSILTKPSGINGFGYDPLFWLPKEGCTMAELTTSEKNRLSHRGKAVMAMIKKLQKVGLID